MSRTCPLVWSWVQITLMFNQSIWRESEPMPGMSQELCLGTHVKTDSGHLRTVQDYVAWVLGKRAATVEDNRTSTVEDMRENRVNLEPPPAPQRLGHA